MSCRSIAFRCAAVASLCLLAAVTAGGCTQQLETGYQYRPLNASPTERRGYYASPYSPEKSAAEQEQRQGGQVHPAAGTR